MAPIRLLDARSQRSVPWWLFAIVILLVGARIAVALY